MTTDEGFRFLQLIQGDITTQIVDVIVNAANTHLQHGGGVALSIAKAAGPTLIKESATLEPILTGSVGVTTAGNLNSKVVFHAVGPVWTGGKHNEENLLASCIYNCLNLAEEKNYSSIAFPAISTGIFGFPLKIAASIIIEEIRKFIATKPKYLRDIRIILFSVSDFSVFSTVLETMKSN